MKKILSLTLALVLVVCMYTIPSFANEANEIIAGDANNDKQISQKDSSTIRRYIANFDIDIDLLAADVNGDDKIESKDVTILRRYLTGWDVELLLPLEATLSGTFDITMWVSYGEGVKDLFQAQIDAFEKANPSITINATIEGVSEADVGALVVNDVANAPDIYCFAQDQLARLIQADALAELKESASYNIKRNNDKSSVAAVSIADKLYAYPMTSDNGYFMYYDKSIISEKDAESLEAIIKACEDNNVKIRFALDNAWYMTSFFFGTGCISNWPLDKNGDFVSVNDNFNSEKGVIAMKGMQKLAQSPCHDNNADIFTDAGVVITGIWNAGAAAKHFGKNIGATDLPSFEVDGKTYHLGSYSGNKLIGVKPQTDKNKAALLSKLAQYLTNEDCQAQRFESLEMGPSNKAAQASDAVQANASLVALAKQAEYALPLGQVHAAWWDIARNLGYGAMYAKSDEDIYAALNNYQKSIDSLFLTSDTQKVTWNVIGGICGTNWDTDFPMTEVAKGVYESAPLELKAGEEYKVRQGASWDINFGANGFNSDANFVVEADGIYKIQFIWDGAKAGIATNILVNE